MEPAETHQRTYQEQEIKLLYFNHFLTRFAIGLQITLNLTVTS